MTTELPQPPLTPEELALRRKKVRNIVLLRAFLFGVIIAAWWIFFAPEALVDPAMKNPMGIAAGLIAMGAYLYFLREALFPKSSTSIDQSSDRRL